MDGQTDGGSATLNAVPRECRTFDHVPIRSERKVSDRQTDRQTDKLSQKKAFSLVSPRVSRWHSCR